MDSKYWLTSLSSLKGFLNKTNTTNDAMLQMFIGSATERIETFCRRKLRARVIDGSGEPAEFQNGDGTPTLYPKISPIISVESLYDDVNRTFDSTTLKTSSDYYIWKDEGKIELLNDALLGSIFDRGQANVKLLYTAGYGTIEIITGRNDGFVVNDGVAEVSIEISQGTYTLDGLATAIATAMNVSALADTYTCVYRDDTQKFYFTSDGSTFELLWTATATISNNIGKTLGFIITSDDTGALAYSADESILGIPEDLEWACMAIATQMYRESNLGGNRQDIVKLKTKLLVLVVQQNSPKRTFQKQFRVFL